MAERNEGRMGPGSRVTTRRLADYEARQRELTDAFTLPDDLRHWITVRVDDSDDSQDTLTLGVTAGRTTTLLTFPVPAAVSKELRSALKDHERALHHQLKLDLATNLLATMTAGPVPQGEEE